MSVGGTCTNLVQLQLLRVCRCLCQLRAVSLFFTKCSVFHSPPLPPTSSSSSSSALSFGSSQIGAAAPTQQVALAFGPLATVIFMLFGGFYVNLDSIPVWLRWIRYISPIQWGFVGAAVNQFSGNRTMQLSAVAQARLTRCNQV